jgi:hypothetical protein
MQSMDGKVMGGRHRETKILNDNLLAQHEVPPKQVKKEFDAFVPPLKLPRVSADSPVPFWMLGN